MIDAGSYRKQVEEAATFLQGRIGCLPRILIVLGTGLNIIAETVEGRQTLPYADIPHFPCTTVASHSGNLVCGRLAGTDTVVLQGRFHFYEGYSTKELTLPVRVLAQLGAHTLIVTNTAGGLNRSFSPGTIMVIRDHLNFMGENPLRGPNIDHWGPRFPDLSESYDKILIKKILACARRLATDDVVDGVYAAIPGPSLETPAETRFLKQCGADAVGMSTVPEVIVARHGGMKVLGLSLIANVNDPDNFAPILLEDVVAKAKAAAPRLERLLLEVIREMD